MTAMATGSPKSATVKGTPALARAKMGMITNAVHGCSVPSRYSRGEMTSRTESVNLRTASLRWCMFTQSPPWRVVSARWSIWLMVFSPR